MPLSSHLRIVAAAGPRAIATSALLTAAFALSSRPGFAQDQTVSGNLTVTGNSFLFGNQGGTPGLNLKYADADTDTLTSFLNRTPGSWLWAHAPATAAMRLTGAHGLILYNADGTTPGITLTPGAAPSLQLGGVALTGGSGLQVNGSLTLTGALSAPTLSIQGGQFSTNANVLALNANAGLLFNAGTGPLTLTSGSNQNIVLTPSGTGTTVLNGNVNIPNGRLAIGTTNPATKVAIAGNMGTDSTLTINNTTFLSNHNEPGNRVSMLGTNLYWNGKIYVAPSVSESGLALEIHQGQNALIFARLPAGSGGPSTIQARIGGNGTDTYFATQGGNVGIGTAAPTQKLTVRGNMAVEGAILVPPQGDLSMGTFTAGPQPTF